MVADVHAAVLKVWSKRYRDLGPARTQVACRPHAVLAGLVSGGFGREITAGRAAALLHGLIAIETWRHHHRRSTN